MEELEAIRKELGDIGNRLGRIETALIGDEFNPHGHKQQLAALHKDVNKLNNKEIARTAFFTFITATIGSAAAFITAWFKAH